MIRLFLALAISSFIGFLPYVSTYPIYPSLPNTLYTVAGIMFSVGMSLVVTMSTQGIHNKEAKIEVQNKIQKLLMKYVLYFSILTLLYILLPSEKDDDIFSFDLASSASYTHPNGSGFCQVVSKRRYKR